MMFMKKHSTIKYFVEDGDESAILTIKYYNPPDLLFQHLPVKKSQKSRS